MSMDKKQIPETGRAPEALLAEMESFKTGDARWKEGRTWSMVYQVDEAHSKFLKQASNLFFSESYINPFAFESLQRMEKEVVAMTADMLNGDQHTVGTMTSGGTESIFLALYTYREWGQKARRGCTEVVAPATIHPAFEKAAHILGLQIRKVPVGEDGKANVAAMKKQIGSKTLMLAASAPSYPHGLLDPIPSISQIAQEHQLPFHVDACIGGFMLPWVEQLRPELIHPWDFRLPGVTSMSADTHKFAYGAKGSSVLLYRSMVHLRHQFFITTDWAGGIYASATLLGSRSGGPIAAAWAAMNSLGRQRYLELARQVMAGADQLKATIEAVTELELIGAPCMNILAFTTRNNRPDIFVVADALAEKGWYVDRQQRPNCIHVTVMPQNLPVLQTYIDDLRSAIHFAKANPKAKAKGNAALYGLMARIPFRGMVAQNVRKMFETLYGEPVETENTTEPEPERWMGWMNRLLSFNPFRR